jgi:hypothetical protein
LKLERTIPVSLAFPRLFVQTPRSSFFTPAVSSYLLATRHTSLLILTTTAVSSKTQTHIEFSIQSIVSNIRKPYIPNISTSEAMVSFMSEQLSALFTTPIPLNMLNSDEHSCPICHEPYIAPPTKAKGKKTTTPDESEGEWPVSVDMFAEPAGLKHCCGHIFGRQCLITHLNGDGAWRNKCPLCRDIWFGKGAVADDVPAAPAPPPAEEPVATLLRRSARIAARATAPQTPPGSSMSARNGVAQRSRSAARVKRGRSTRRAGFLEEILGALDMQNGDEVNGTLEEVEEILSTFYGGREE